MTGRLIDVTASAYRFPLLIKHLLDAPMLHAADQEIVYRDRTRLTYRQLGERIGRLASALNKLGVSLIAQHAAAMSGAHDLGYFYQLLAMAGWTSLPWLRSLPQPTLVLMGGDDPLVPPINGRILAGLIPNAELRMIDDGHLFMVTRPTESAALIEELLAGGSKHVEP